MTKKLQQLQEKLREAHERVQEDLAKTSDTVTQATARMRAQLERIAHRKTEQLTEAPEQEHDEDRQGEHQQLKAVR